MSGKHKNPMYNLRIPAEIKDALKREAQSNFRSLNEEIKQRLIKSLKDAKGNQCNS